jgi:general secretion pathway protein G
MPVSRPPASPHARTRPAAPRGLTLIEVLIVIAILLAIGGLVVVNLIPRKEQADVDLTRTQLKAFDNALRLFRLDMNRYPTEDEGLVALWSRDAIEDEEEQKKWKSYLELPKPKDTWGSDWIYRNPSEVLGEGFYDIVSIGKDREEGTEDDITNHDEMLDEEGELSEEFDTFTPADVEGGGGGTPPRGG